MPDRRPTDHIPNDRRPDVPLSLPELFGLAVEGGWGFRLEEMLDRIERRP
jgi:hypothetical protein